MLIICCFIVYLILAFLLAGISETRKSNLFSVGVLSYLLLGLIFILCIVVKTEFVSPFKREVITDAIIEGEFKKGKQFNTIYWYNVNGKFYSGSFSKFHNKYSDMYDSGDTINITYNPDEPTQSIPSFQQYWYFNKEKERYWIKIKKGEGRRLPIQ